MAEKVKNKVFIATSMDGFIADKKGGIDFLESVPELNTVDSGYAAFMQSVDALVMGRHTFETVLGFDIPWPYEKPVYVMSTTLKQIPKELQDKVFLVQGILRDVLKDIHSNGHFSLYIDGGKTIQSFLKEDLIDEMIITQIPVILGEGISLLGPLDQMLKFQCISSQIFVEKVPQLHYIRSHEK